MTDTKRHPEAEADAAADRISYLFLLLMLGVSFVVNAASTSFDIERGGLNPGMEPWLRELASHLALLIVTPIIPWALSKWPVQSQNWLRQIPWHIGATLMFSAIHILMMVYMRKLSYPPLLGETYNFGLKNPDVWLYEYRKDVFTFFIIFIGFFTNRAAMQFSREADSARASARTGGRITLKCGGRTFFVNADDVIAARAASNYVEVETAAKVYLARMTLTELEALLQEAGSSHIRVHRSHLIHADRIREITPNGQGDVLVTLDTGAQVPGSRRYRARLPEAGRATTIA